MPAINAEALSKYVGLLYVAPKAAPTAWVRLSSVRNLIANFDNTVNQVEIKADDTGTVFKGFTPEARIEGEFLENIERDTMDMLLGGTPTNVAATPVPVTGEALGTGWTKGRPIKLANKNGANTIVASITIDAAGSPLILNTDYATFVGDGISTELGYTYITPLTAQSGVLDADYTYTPNATEDLVFSIAFQESELLLCKIVATSGTKTRTITLSECTFEGIYGMSFLDVVEAGDLTGTTFTFKGTSSSTFTISNQIL